MRRFWEEIQKPYLAVAPMVGNSEEAWRRLSKRHGANLFYTEMVHCESFLRGSRNPVKNRWYTTSESDRPLVIQICGNSPKTMLEAALIMQNHCDAIDINFGCPQKVARKGGYGAYLQENWDLTERIVKVLSTGLNVPVSCKIRVFESIEKTVEYAKMIEKAGCSLLAVHGRTRDQKGPAMGLASWDHIKAVKENLKIPVLSNGNIMTHEDVWKCLEYTKCDGVMVGEAHLYNPLIFTGENKSCLEIIREYLDICMESPGCAETGHIKSHMFKLLHSYFTINPEKQPDLDSCSTIDQFYNLYLNLVKEAESAVSKEVYLSIYKMAPLSISGASIHENNSKNK
ncbi:tRNA-dihydrouridine synthase [Encephalitozoon intestinalis ATCC 50506]|uniref:tRNA-dihydrouridine synthase n=1 Tax=Encephalitozoon intestinalis (strain ATCC 50506) TaxID=876142 RepID=E0S882_ENCIT|nr:tRNA-dihydrouridine synthase [Encephalitozoon intestinalis ATCC 50506]ADM11917.1 tRNA-dihydrouridine synthase [Encephalitozoon intestinalis ATCC 50506]UTX45673.1 tRNA-dihydrouridine synthase [Encephalitozoon intestinalis]